MALSNGVLVLRALGIGDLLTGVPAMRALRRAFPDERTVLATPPDLAGLVELIEAADELLPAAGPTEFDWPGPGPSVAVNLHGRGPQSTSALLGLEPQRLISHAHWEFPDLDGPQWAEGVHEVDRWCALLEYYGISTDRTDLRLADPPGPSPAPAAAVVHPGAAYPARRWPPDRFARVARALHVAGHRVVITGSAEERELARTVAGESGLSDEDVLAGQLDLADVAALVAMGRLVVCGDTGIGHLATAFGTPSVVLFGPTPPAEWGPPPNAPQHVGLWAGEPGNPWGDRTDPGLLKISEDEVLRAVDRALNGERADD